MAKYPNRQAYDHYVAMQIGQEVIDDVRAQALSLDDERDRLRLRHLIFKIALNAMRDSDHG